MFPKDCGVSGLLCLLVSPSAETLSRTSPLREAPHGGQLEGLTHQGRFAGVPHETCVGAVQVAYGGLPHVAAPNRGSLHALDCPLTLQVVLELSDGGDHVLSELSRRRLVDRLTTRPQADTEPQEQGADDLVVVGVPREPRQVLNDEVLHSPFVLPCRSRAVLENSCRCAVFADSPASRNTLTNSRPC